MPKLSSPTDIIGCAQNIPRKGRKRCFAPWFSSTRQALLSLVQQEMLYHDKDGYIVYDRFLAMWLTTMSGMSEP